MNGWLLVLYARQISLLVLGAITWANDLALTTFAPTNRIVCLRCLELSRRSKRSSPEEVFP